MPSESTFSRAGLRRTLRRLVRACDPLLAAESSSSSREREGEKLLHIGGGRREGESVTAVAHEQCSVTENACAQGVLEDLVML